MCTEYCRNYLVLLVVYIWTHLYNCTLWQAWLLCWFVAIQLICYTGQPGLQISLIFVSTTLQYCFKKYSQPCLKVTSHGQTGCRAVCNFLLFWKFFLFSENTILYKCMIYRLDLYIVHVPNMNTKIIKKKSSDNDFDIHVLE